MGDYLAMINTNGIRSAAKKGFFDWLKTADADYVCVQETKAQPEDLSDALFTPAGYHAHFRSAVKKGYSGVGLYTRDEPSDLIIGFGSPEEMSEIMCRPLWWAEGLPLKTEIHEGQRYVK